MKKATAKQKEKAVRNEKDKAARAKVAARDAKTKKDADAAAAARLAEHAELLKREDMLIAQLSEEAVAKVAAKRATRGWLGWRASHAHISLARDLREVVLAEDAPLSEGRTFGLNMLDYLPHIPDSKVIRYRVYRSGNQGWHRTKLYAFEAGVRSGALHALGYCYYAVRHLLTPFDPPPKKRGTRR